MRFDDGYNHKGHNDGRNAASHGGKAQRRSHAFLVPAVCKQSHGNQAAQAVAHACGNGAQEKLGERGSKAVRKEAHRRKEACQRNATAHVKQLVIAVDHKHNKQGHNRAHRKNERTACVTNAFNNY